MQDKSVGVIPPRFKLPVFVKSLKKIFKSLMPEKQWLKFVIFLGSIRQFLNKDEELYFKNKALSCRIVQPKGSKSKVIILGLRTFATHNLSVLEKVLSDLFRHNNAVAKVLICDNILQSCDVEERGELTQEIYCYKCRKERKKYKQIYSNEYLSFSQYISPKEIEESKSFVSSLNDKDLFCFTYLGVNLAGHAIDSTIRRFRKGSIVPDDCEHLKIMRNSILQGVISLKVAKQLLEKEKPTHLVSLHGCYISWGPFCDYCTNHGVHVVIYEKATIKMGYFSFSNCGGFASPDNRKTWDMYKETELSTKQKEELKSFMDKKRKGDTLDYKLFNMGKKANMEYNRIQNVLNSNKYKKFALYPNLLWDRGLETLRPDKFKDVFEWMFRTIDYFIQHEDRYLLIKPHPAEASISYTEMGVEQVIADRYKTLPNNIIVIPKDYPVTSYDLMDKGCIGITYNGSVGIEYSYFKKPILVGINTHYTDNGLTLKIDSIEEYFNAIRNPDKLCKYPAENYSLIEKYAYFFYFRLILPVPFFRKDRWLGHCIDWNVLKDYVDFIRHDRIMNYIARSIVEKKPVIKPDHLD